MCRISWALAAALVLVSAVCCSPLLGLEDLETEDSASVGSYVREVRAAPPESYHISYDDEGEGEVGYDRKKEGKGKKGYQKFDSFHKKDGDSYAFEKHDSYGHDDDKKAEASGHDDDDGHGAYSERRERKAPKKSEKYQEAPVDDYESSSSSYDVSEGDADDGGSQGPPPQAAYTSSGYDEADAANYELPGGYVYGQGDEYNF